MIPKIKKILYATDLSPNARYAFSYAASMAEKYDAKITILHVFEELSPSSNVRLSFIMGEDRWQELTKDKAQKVFDEVHRRLEKFCDDMHNEFTECQFIVEDILVKEGNPSQQILTLTEQKDYDIVVMGTHGAGFLADAMMGSTARRVVRRCQLPVMVIRLPEEME